MNAPAVRSALVCALCIALALASGFSSAQTTYRLTDLGAFAAGFSTGQTANRAINAVGQVTGQSSISTDYDGVYHAFLWNGTTLQDLGTHGGLYSVATSINDWGHVAGYADTSDDAATHAFLWDGTAMQDLGTLGSTLGGSVGFDINNAGHVTGESTNADETEIHAFLWNGTAMQDLGTLGGSYSSGLAINDSGKVIGQASTANGAYHAFLWNGTTMRDLGTLGGSYSAAFDVNGSGQITGYANVANDADHAFLWNGTAMQDLGTLGGSYSSGLAINDSGQVTGQATTAEGAYHAFLWNGTTMQDLGTLGGSYSLGDAINAAGHVTGAASTANDAEYRAFVWNGNTIRDLNSLINPADSLRRYVTLTYGHDINDLGQIVADGCDSRSNECHAYLLSPITDTTPPLIRARRTGTLGKGGWYVSNVTIAWEVSDPESTISEKSGCDLITIWADTAGRTLTCTATSAGGTTMRSVTIKRDATAPSVSIVTPARGATYKRNQVVIANFKCSDKLSRIQTCIGTVANGQRIDTSKKAQKAKFKVTATDGAGNTQSLAATYAVN